jgi:predicted  nucleic acid-binding Zn-ribbon protein
MKQQQQQGGNSEGLAGISKMTLAQAITLITLRLGKVETQMHHMHHDHDSISNSNMSFASGEGAEGMENMVMVDKTLMDSIMSRLESLEKRSPTATSGSGADLTLLKQQFDAIKPSIAQNTKIATALTKEQKDHKQQMDALKTELLETKTLLNAIQTLSVDNSQKIFQLMSGEVGNEEEVNEFTDVNDEDADASEDVDGDGESDELDITGANLKGLIEQELNA